MSAGASPLDMSTFKPLPSTGSAHPSLDMSTFKPVGGTPAPMPAKPNPVGDGLTENSKGEGVYPMVDSGGKTVQIPYSKVQAAASLGHRFQSKPALQQYARDHAADPLSEDAVDKYIDGLSWYNPVKLGSQVLAGVGTGALKTVTGADRMPQSHGAGGKIEQDAQLLAATPTKGAEAGGEAVENIGEWFTGEELLGMLGKAGETMGLAEKTKNLSGLAQTIEKCPMVGKLLKIGTSVVKNHAVQTAVKQGTIGAAQTYAKTGDPGAAAETGLIAGVAAPLAEGASARVGAAREAAGAVKPGAADVVQGKIDEILDSISPNKVSKEQTGTAVKTAIGKINEEATTAANAAYNPLKAPLGLAIDAKPGEIEAAARAAAEPKASTVLGADGKPVMTPGDGGKAMAQYKAAKTAYIDSRATINRELVQKIVKTNRPELVHEFIAKASLDDLRTVLPRLDEGTRAAVSRNVMQNVVEAGGDPAKYNANAALKAYDALNKDGAKASLLFGEDAPAIRNNIQRIAEMTKTPKQAQEFGKALQTIMRNMYHGAVVGSVLGGAAGQSWEAGTIGGSIGAGVAATPDVMRMIMGSPKIGGFLTSAIQMGARPEVYGPMIAKMIQAQYEQEQQQQQEGQQ